MMYLAGKSDIMYSARSLVKHHLTMCGRRNDYVTKTTSCILCRDFGKNAGAQTHNCLTWKSFNIYLLLIGTSVWEQHTLYSIDNGNLYSIDNMCCWYVKRKLYSNSTNWIWPNWGDKLLQVSYTVSYLNSISFRSCWLNLLLHVDLLWVTSHERLSYVWSAAKKCCRAAQHKHASMQPSYVYPNRVWFPPQPSHLQQSLFRINRHKYTLWDYHYCIHHSWLLMLFRVYS